MQALRQVDILKKQLDELLPMKEEYKRELDKKIRLEFNYNSNHMEGNTFTYGETKLLLLFGQTSAGKTIRDTEEMKAHDVAYKMITDWAANKEYVLTERDIKELNRIILVEPFKKATKTLDGQPSSRIINIGDYKQQSNSVETATGEIFEFASPIETPAKMGDLMQWYRDEEEKREFDAVSLAALFHYRFVRIHPFDDGNGRISRLLMNYILLKNGYPPVVIKSADKHNYLAALRMADADDIEAFIEYVAEQLQWSLELFLKAAKGEGVDEPGDFDKKVILLKQRLNRPERIDVQRSKLVIQTVLQMSMAPLIKAINTQIGKFDSLFKSRASLLTHPDDIVPHSKTTLLQLVDDLSGGGEKYHFLYTITLVGLRDSKKSQKNVSVSIQFVFLKFIYEVRSFEANMSVEKSYDEELSEVEIVNGVTTVGNYLLAKIESLLS